MTVVCSPVCCAGFDSALKHQLYAVCKAHATRICLTVQQDVMIDACSILDLSL